MNYLARACVGCAAMAVASQAQAGAPVLAPLDFSTCANFNQAIGQPVGAGKGNAATKDAHLTFTLLDPAAGNNFWLGAATGATLDIKLSVASPTAVYALMNTQYGQSAIANATVVFKGTGKTHKSFKLIGNKTIRDFNNWVWTDTINGTSAQEWWTNNLNPQPDDQSHRLDAHKFTLAPTFTGQTLTDIIFEAPANAGTNYMQPFVAAVGLQYAGGATPVPTTCTAN
jgi:hypothetical protein